MKFGDREGPSVETIPPRTIHSCFGCKHHRDDMLVHRMVGENDYEASCSHPQVMDSIRTLTLPRLIGRHHGMSPPTPQWCPFLKKPSESENGQPEGVIDSR